MSDRLLIDMYRSHLRAATMRGAALDDLVLVSTADAVPVGAVYLGRVRRVLSGINGAFVDIGAGEDGFLRGAMARFSGAGAAPAADRPGDGEQPKIGDYVTEGQTVAVQVVRPGIDGKGPVLTTDLTLPGRYVVLKAVDPSLSVSRRIADPETRRALTALIDPLCDGTHGFIVRTLAADAATEAVRGEAERLRGAWREVAERLRSAAAPARVDDPIPPLLAVLREAESAAVAAIRVAGSAATGARVPEISAMWPDLADRLEIDHRPEDLFKREGVDEALAPYLRPHVELAGGGMLSIERTRALTAVDVDTGSRSAERATPGIAANLEAAAEIARQLRIRNLGGLVVVDFVRMRRRDDRAKVVAALRQAVDDDRSRVQVLGMSPLGLVEMSRERNAYAALDHVMPVGATESSP